MSYRFASLSSGLLARKGTAAPAMATHAGGNPRPLREQVSFVTAHEPTAEFRPNQALNRAGFTFDATEPAPPPFAAEPPRALAPAPRPAPAPAPMSVPPPRPVAPAPGLLAAKPLFGAAAPQPAAPARPADPAPILVPSALAEPMREATAADACRATAACVAAEQAGLDPARRFHVSVRLRQGHFVRLKLAAAQLRKPSQEIVADALSAYFRSLDPTLFGDCACSKE